MLNKTIKMIMKSLFVSAILTVMLVPAFSQFTNGFDIDKGPTTIAVLDFVNNTDYKLNNPGGTISAAVALSFEREKTLQFETVDPAVVSAAIRELGYNSATVTNEILLAQLTDYIGVNNIVSGEIREIKPVRDGNGSYVEVTVHAKVINRVTQRPINGATITQRSSAIYGYTGTGETLVDEALTAAGYALVQKMLANRFPYTSVILSSDPLAVQLRGNNGWRVGQEAVAISAGFRTATLRVTEVTGSTTICRTIATTRGVSTGNMVIAVYEEKFEDAIIGKPPVKDTLLKIGGTVIAGVLIYTLANNVDKQWRWDSTPTAYPIANIATTPLPPVAGVDANNAYAGNYVTWPRMEGSPNIVAYVIYRDEPGVIGANFRDIPIAIVDGSQNYYVDAPPADYYAYLRGSSISPTGNKATYILYSFELRDEMGTIVDVTPEGELVYMDYMWPLSSFSTNLPDVSFVERDETSYIVGILNRAPFFGDLCRYRVEAVYVATNTSADASSSEEGRSYVLKTSLSNLSSQSRYIKYPIYESEISGSSITIRLVGDNVQKDQYKRYIEKYVLQISPRQEFDDISKIITIPNGWFNSNTLAYEDIQKAVESVISPDQLKDYYFRVGIAPSSSNTQPKVITVDSYPKDNSGLMDGYVWSYPLLIRSSTDFVYDSMNTSRADLSRQAQSRSLTDELVLSNKLGSGNGRTHSAQGTKGPGVARKSYLN